MKLIPVHVKCNSGLDEYPISFIYNGIDLIITEITDRWYQGENNPEFPVSDYFKVTASNESFILKHDKLTDLWYILIRG